MQNRRNAKLIVYLLLLFSIFVTAWLLSRRTIHKEVKKKTEVKLSADRKKGLVDR